MKKQRKQLLSSRELELMMMFKKLLILRELDLEKENLEIEDID